MYRIKPQSPFPSGQLLRSFLAVSQIFQRQKVGLHEKGIVVDAKGWTLEFVESWINKSFLWIGLCINSINLLRLDSISLKKYNAFCSCVIGVLKQFFQDTHTRRIVLQYPAKTIGECFTLFERRHGNFVICAKSMPIMR